MILKRDVVNSTKGVRTNELYMLHIYIPIYISIFNDQKANLIFYIRYSYSRINANMLLRNVTSVKSKKLT